MKAANVNTTAAPSPRAAALRAQARQLRAQLAAIAAVADSLDTEADTIEATPSAPAPAAPLAAPVEAAAACGVSIATFNREVKAGRIPFVIVGDSRRYDLDAVRAALASSTSTGSSSPRALPPAPASGPELAAEPAPVVATPGVRRVSVGGAGRGRRS